MGLIDEIFMSLGPSGRTDKKLAKLMSEGELVPARIYAIKSEEHVDSADDWYYGLDAQTSNGPLRASIRQTITKHPERAQLGANVKARHLDGRLAIDWPSTLADFGLDTKGAESYVTKFLKTTLEPGIHDNHFDAKKLAKGTRAIGRVRSCEMFEMMGMPTKNWNIEVEFEHNGTQQTAQLKRDYVPPYALELLKVGAELPIVHDPDKPGKANIDWAMAAEAAASP